MLPREVFIGPFAQTLGLEKAESLFIETLSALSIPEAECYSSEDCQRILEHFDDQGGLMSIIVSTIKTRLVLDGLLTPTEMRNCATRPAGKNIR